MKFLRSDLLELGMEQLIMDGGRMQTTKRISSHKDKSSGGVQEFSRGYPSSICMYSKARNFGLLEYCTMITAVGTQHFKTKCHKYWSPGVSWKHGRYHDDHD